MSNALQSINPIQSDKVTTKDLCLALLCDLGVRCSNMPREVEGDKAYSNEWEFFNPFLVKTLEDYDSLPEHWQSLIRNQNEECWKCGYTYVHAPEPIITKFPRTPLKGIFVVLNGETDVSRVNISNLMHTGGQFIEYDTKDKGLWLDKIKENGEDCV